MAVREKVVYKNHNPTLYIYTVISPEPFLLFIVDAISWKVIKILK